MTSRFVASWAGELDEGALRALAAVLRCYSWDEAEAALAELVEQSATHPAVVDVAARAEAVRRRGPASVSGRVATKTARARAVLRARRALVLAAREAKESA